MRLSWTTIQGSEDSTQMEAMVCTMALHGNVLTVRQIDGRFVISCYPHRLEMGPQPGDREITIRNIEDCQKAALSVEAVSLHRG